MKYRQFFQNNKKMLLALLCILVLCGFVLANQVKETKAPEKEKEIAKPVQKDAIKVQDYYGFLFLGSDKGAAKTNGGNHTDSVMYVAYHPKQNKAFIMPIYRDTLLTLSCGGEVNINHVYRDYGSACLMDSVAKTIGLPVDYYVYTTADAFVSVTDSIGGIDVVPTETFCSEYSNDQEKYCVNSGTSYKMSGNMLLAYARDRNHGSGIPRADRHQAILSSFMKTCLNNVQPCVSEVSKEIVKGNIAHNIPFTSLADMKTSILTPNTQIEAILMGHLQGENYADGAGVWHMKLDPADIEKKRTTIITAFGTRA